MGHRHPNSLAALRPAKKGEVRNPRGVNGWTKLRDRARERLAVEADELIDVLFEEARKGNVQALRLALGAVLDIRCLQLMGEDGSPVNFADLARKARDSRSGVG